MPNLGIVSFHSARASGTLFKHLGSGIPDYVGFFGPNGTASAVEVNSFQDTTFMVDVNGAVPSYLGAESGKLTNCKYITSNVVRISGLPLGPYQKFINQVNVFHVQNLNTYPNFRNRPSGTLMIMYMASGVSKVNTYNATLWAYDRTGALTDPPPDMVVMGFEINASGQWFNTAQSGIWNNMAGQNTALAFTNHSPTNGWRKEHKHIFVCGLSAKPTSVGILNDAALAFRMSFA